MRATTTSHDEMQRDTRAGPAVPRKIVGFHHDEEMQWVAQLECGHTQHVRHDPPWQVRDWVTTPEGREARIGTTLECVKCLASSGGGARGHGSTGR